VLYDDTGFDTQRSLEFTGFQYADVVVDRAHPDLLGLVRTAYRGANSYHNANRQTLVKVRDFRAAVREALERDTAVEGGGDDADAEGDEIAWWRALGYAGDGPPQPPPPSEGCSGRLPVERCFWHGDNRCCGGRCRSRADAGERAASLPPDLASQ
jgi:hypothetical protein